MSVLIAKIYENNEFTIEATHKALGVFWCVIKLREICKYQLCFIVLLHLHKTPTITPLH